jgi:hypothetical protein
MTDGFVSLWPLFLNAQETYTAANSHGQPEYSGIDNSWEGEELL